LEIIDSILTFQISAPYVSPLEKNRGPDTISQLSLHSGGSQTNSRTNTLERQVTKTFTDSLPRNATIQEVNNVQIKISINF